MSGHTYLAALSGVWAIQPEKAGELLDLARRRLNGWRPTDDERRALIDARQSRRGAGAAAARAVAVIPVHGTIAHRANSFAASSGGASTEAIGFAVDAVAEDPSIEHVVFDFDSPGGSVDGVPELAAKIAALSARKRTTAAVNSLAASAAYWLATQCREITITPSGQAGSIGVYMLFEDWSENLAKEGIRMRPISAGENKLEGAFWQPMSAETRAHFQRSVDDSYRAFVGAVASGRGVSRAVVESRFGQGRVYDAAEAVSRGMADRVEPFDATLAALASGRSAGQRGVAESARRRAALDAACILALTEHVL